MVILHLKPLHLKLCSASSGLFFSKKENVLVVVISKIQYPEKRKCSGGCIFGRNGLEDWPKGEVTHERKLSRAH